MLKGRRSSSLRSFRSLPEKESPVTSCVRIYFSQHCPRQWMVAVVLVVPLIFWLLSLAFATRVFEPESYSTSMDSPDMARKVYENIVSYKSGGAKSQARYFQTSYSNRKSVMTYGGPWPNLSAFKCKSLSRMSSSDSDDSQPPYAAKTASSSL